MVSGAGKEAMDELFNHTKSSFVHEQSPPEQFTKEIAFNCIPHIDKFMDDGSTKEEWKMVVETKKILDPSIKVSATCVRVPVFISHSEAINIEFERPISVEEARELLFPHFKANRDRIGRERGWSPPSRQQFDGEVAYGSLYVGSPETVAQKIAYAMKSIGAQRFDFKYCNGPMTRSQMLRSIELYATQVIPRVRELLA